MISGSAVGAVVLDASFVVALCSKEAGRIANVNAALNKYLNAGYDFYSPGAIVVETLYVLCGKAQNGLLTVVEHAQAVLDFHTLMLNVLPPPSGEAAILLRAEAIRGGYGCSRSADGIYIALADELTITMPTVILTLDQNMANQAARHASTVTIDVII